MNKLKGCPKNHRNGVRMLPDFPTLWAKSNNINDISILEYLPNLHDITFSYNNISDLKPLADNEDYGDYGDLIIDNNPLSQQSIDEYIPIIESRGIHVYR